MKYTKTYTNNIKKLIKFNDECFFRSKCEMKMTKTATTPV